MSTLTLPHHAKKAVAAFLQLHECSNSYLCKSIARLAEDTMSMDHSLSDSRQRAQSPSVCCTVAATTLGCWVYCCIYLTKHLEVWPTRCEFIHPSVDLFISRSPACPSGCGSQGLSCGLLQTRSRASGWWPTRLGIDDLQSSARVQDNS
jgi:hypothetical protein